jgi:hypothetical protein
MAIGAILLSSCSGLVSAQQAEPAAGRGGRGPAATYWVAKTKGGVYVPPNKPLVKLAGEKPALWVEIKPLNYVYPGDGPQPPAAPGAEIVKVSFGRTPTGYTAPNIPHWNLFEKDGAHPGRLG